MKKYIIDEDIFYELITQSRLLRAIEYQYGNLAEDLLDENWNATLPQNTHIATLLETGFIKEVKE